MKKVENIKEIQTAYVNAAKQLKVLIAEIDKIPADEKLELKTTLLTEAGTIVKTLAKMKADITAEF